MYYTTEKITDRIYQITCPEAANSQLVIGDEKALLFDTAYGFGDLYAEVRKLTDKPLIVVNSHGHLDHVNGNYMFEGPVYIHEKDLALAKVHSGVAMRKGSVDEAHHKFNPMTNETSDILPEGFDEDKYVNAVFPPFALTKEGDEFDLGGVKLEVIELPGHTRGSIGLWCRKEEILLAGDAFGPFTWLFADEAATLPEYIRSLHKAQGLEARLTLGGHEAHGISPETLNIYVKMAEHADFEKGIPWQPPLLTSTSGDIRVIVRDGYEPFRFDLPGYASIVISREHLTE